jgi:hypothetical protein
MRAKLQIFIHRAVKVLNKGVYAIPLKGYQRLDSNNLAIENGVVLRKLNAAGIILIVKVVA